METIILKDGDILKDKTFGNCEFDLLIDVQGDNVVIDNLLVYSPKKDFHRVIRVKGKNCKITNCRFSDFSVNGPIIVVEHKEEPDCCLIQECLFMSRRKTKSNNGLEAIRLGESKTCLSNGNNIIYNCRFEDYDGEIECISVKNNNNLIINNELINSASTITLRHTNNSIVGYNIIDGKLKKDSGGIRVCGDNNFVLGNVIQNIKGSGLRSAVSLMCGVKNYPNNLNRYEPIKICNINDNVFFSCANVYALGMLKKEADIRPLKVILNGNLNDRCRNKHSIVKDNVNCLAAIENEIKKYPYDTIPHKFNIKSFEELYNEVLNYKKEIKEEVKEEVKEEKCDVNTITKLVKRLNLTSKMKQMKEIQQNLTNNMSEFRELMKELKEVMNQ